MELFYGTDDQRIKSILSGGSQVQRIKYFFGDYEEITENGSTKKYYYFDSPTGLCGIFVKGSQSDTLWYAYTDHLGSLIYLVNADNSNQYLEYSYDAWGNPREVDDWTEPLAGSLFAQRGFTGHEHMTEFCLINMNGRVYDPALGRFLSPDPFVQDPVNSQSFNRYSYCLNNPLIYTDPDGEIFWILPNIGWSKEGGLSLGVSVVVGIPGLWSAQAGVGYNFKSNDVYVYAGATVATVTGYASWSSSSGFNVGWSAGLTPYGGFPISTNFFSTGANFNLSGYGSSMNISAWTFSENGTSFNPSVSAMVFSEHATNLVRGGGFRSNNQILRRYDKAGNQKGALDYFGFEGEYRPEKAAGGEYVEGDDYFGSVNPTTGDISYGKLAFSSYDHLYSTYVKEAFTSIKVKSGEPILTQKGYDFRRIGGKDLTNYPEEAAAFIAMYKKNGFYPSIRQKSILSNINYYQGEIYVPNMHPNFMHRHWHVIYRIPRKW